MYIYDHLAQYNISTKQFAEIVLSSILNTVHFLESHVVSMGCVSWWLLELRGEPLQVVKQLCYKHEFFGDQEAMLEAFYILT